MKVVLPARVKSSLSNTRSCSADECVLATREGKPYCPEHVELNPYSRRVAADIRRRADEDDRIRQGLTAPTDVNLRGITAQEILQNLVDHGARTKQRLCRELNLEISVIDVYIDALLAHNIITLSLTTRGSTMVSLRRK
jgi:hypothetical protein